MGQWGACARKKPFDVHGNYPLTCCNRWCYGAPRGSAVSIGEIGCGRERPPFFTSRIGTAGLADVHCRALA